MFLLFIASAYAKGLCIGSVQQCNTLEISLETASVLDWYVGALQWFQSITYHGSQPFRVYVS